MFIGKTHIFMSKQLKVPTFLYFCSQNNMVMQKKVFYIYRAIAHYRGMERIFVDKINSLVRLYGYDVWLITADQGKHPLAYPLDEKAHHVDLNIRFHSASKYIIPIRHLEKIRLQYLFVKRLKNLIAQQNPDVLICNTDVFTNLVIMSKGKVPVIVESHCICRYTCRREDEKFHHRFIRWYTFWNYRHADSFVALTEADAMEWKKYNSKAIAITNIVHLNPLNRISDCNSKHVIFTSRFARQKGILYLLDIWKIVNAKHPDWQLDIYAQGEFREQYIPLIEQLDINIHVHEGTLDVFNRYCDSSIFLLTSIFEPFGLVLPEAMSCGLPVVSFDCDFGPREIITDGVDGFLVPLGDIEGYAAKVCQLIEDEDLRRRMGQNGIVSSQRYRAENIMPKWIKLFEELASGR